MVSTIYCRNGHFNGNAPEFNERYRNVGVFHEWQERQVREGLARLAFCPKCGAANINGCPHCKTTIESGPECTSERPSYCGACSKPFPWTETALTIAREYTDELEELSTEDKKVLKGTFDDLIVYTPRTEVAVTRFKRVLKKAGSGAGEVLTKVFVDLASETIVKLLKG
jgi:hypothetical protein